MDAVRERTKWRLKISCGDPWREKLKEESEIFEIVLVILNYCVMSCHTELLKFRVSSVPNGSPWQQDKLIYIRIYYTYMYTFNISCFLVHLNFRGRKYFTILLYYLIIPFLQKISIHGHTGLLFTHRRALFDIRRG